MIGPLPDEVVAALQPMPADFDVAFTERPGVLHWRGNLVVERPGSRETIACEVGARLAADTPLAAARQHLRELVWHARELARIGHVDGLKALRTGRHQAHPVSHPQIPPPPPDQAA